MGCASSLALPRVPQTALANSSIICSHCKPLQRAAAQGKKKPSAQPCSSTLAEKSLGQALGVCEQKGRSLSLIRVLSICQHSLLVLTCVGIFAIKMIRQFQSLLIALGSCNSSSGCHLINKERAKILCKAGEGKEKSLRGTCDNREWRMPADLLRVDLFPQPGNADIPCITAARCVSCGGQHSYALTSVQVLGNNLRTTPRVTSLGIVTSSRNSQALNTLFCCCFTTSISFLARAGSALSPLGPSSAGYKVLQFSLATGLVLDSAAFVPVLLPL